MACFMTSTGCMGFIDSYAVKNDVELNVLAKQNNFDKATPDGR